MTGPILLPYRRGVKFDEPAMLDWGGELAAPLGGESQTLMRLGTRHQLAMTIPMMRSEPDGRTWAATLRLAKLYGALAWYRQDGFDPGVTGSPVVDGARQTGSTLALRGFVPGYAIRFGQAFSHVRTESGLPRRRLYFAAANARAGADGKVSLPIFPMLRAIPGDGDVCEFARPHIQGSLGGNEVRWKRLTSPYCDFGTVTITEQG